MDIFNENEYKLIDINCYFGYWPDRTEPITEIKQINKHLDKGFSHICLTSTKALLLNSYQGNKEIYEFASSNSKILSVIVLPHHLEAIYDVNIFNESWTKIFRAISVNNMEEHKWLDYIGEIEGIIIVPYCMRSYSRLSSIAEKYSSISFVLTAINYPQLTEVLPLLKTLKNVYVEISSFQLCNGIEYLSKNIGPEKILFGSNFPIYTSESALLKFNKADMDYQKKKMIARDNMERLLRGSLL